jgi:hypothetical protein
MLLKYLQCSKDLRLQDLFYADTDVVGGSEDSPSTTVRAIHIKGETMLGISEKDILVSWTNHHHHHNKLLYDEECHS